MKACFQKKKNARRVLTQHWIFGSICRKTNESIPLQVPNRINETMMSVNKKNNYSHTFLFWLLAWIQYCQTNGHIIVRIYSYYG